MLSELFVNRVHAYFVHRSALRIFVVFGFINVPHRINKHSIAFVERQNKVLDSEWLWIFDCPHFDDLRFTPPVSGARLIVVGALTVGFRWYKIYYGCRLVGI